MLRGSVAFEQAVEGPHVGVVRAEAWVGGRRAAKDLPLSEGSVTGDSSSFVRRSAGLTFAEETTKAAALLSEVLATPGAEVRVWRGVRIGDGTQTLPVHWGLSEQPKWEWPARTVSVTSPDLAQRVAYYRFPKPRRSSRGMTVAQQIEALVREALPRVRFVDESGDFTAVSDVVWERDRNDAVSKLATSIGCETFFRPDGAWVLRPVASMTSAASHRVREGVNLSSGSVETDWSGVRNWIVALNDRGDGLSLFGESKDNDPSSPTWISGALGPRTGFYSSELFTTNAQCINAARAIRARMQGARVSVAYEALAHPGVEAGERHDVTMGGTLHRLILDRFTLPIFGAGMTGEGRVARALAPEES